MLRKKEHRWLRPEGLSDIRGRSMEERGRDKGWDSRSGWRRRRWWCRERRRRMVEKKRRRRTVEKKKRRRKRMKEEEE
jgi:hypothetical protein